MSIEQRLLLCFYGDDFTGSTDALEFMTRDGARTVLFISPPTPDQLKQYPGLQAIGVAGMTRSMSPDAMEKELRPAFSALRDLGVPHVHYKVCSTFDSSSKIGSIGRAIDVGMEIFPGRFVPLLVGAPPLGRYCLFGNLFARMGIGTAGRIYRLDRHPSMSRHPVTPADEADLRIHLGRQTTRKIGLFDILKFSLPPEEARAALRGLVDEGADVVLFDVLEEDQLGRIGALIDDSSDSGEPLFSVGSSGVEMALGAHWAAQGKLNRKTTWPDPGPAGSMLVISGSCSPVTEQQIAWAISNGFAEFAIDTPALTDESKIAQTVQTVVSMAVAPLKAGKSVIVHTARGDSDPRVSATSQLLQTTRNPSASVLGDVLGRVVNGVLQAIKLRRVVVAGGDTSSYAARALGIQSVEMIAPISPGAPLCLASAPGSPADGLEIIFKGGQVGGPEFFGLAASGKLAMA